MNDTNERIKKLKVEDIIWIIYIFIIGICLYSNSVERKFLKYNDINARNKYRYLIIFIFTVALIIYIYYAIDNYKDIKQLKEENSNQKIICTHLAFIASALVLISGAIYLFISLYDTNVEVELAFN